MFSDRCKYLENFDCWLQLVKILGTVQEYDSVGVSCLEGVLLLVCFIIPYSFLIIKSSLIVGLMLCNILYKCGTSSQSSCFSFLGTRQLKHVCPLLQGTITKQFTEFFHVALIFLNLVGFLNYHLGGSESSISSLQTKNPLEKLSSVRHEMLWSCKFLLFFNITIYIGTGRDIRARARLGEGNGFL